MRIMAIDYGDAHTGVAISDPTGLLAGTTTTIHSRKDQVVLEELRRLIEQYQVDELVMGLPPEHGRDGGPPGPALPGLRPAGGGGHRPQARAVGRAAHHHRRPPHPL